MVPHSRATKKNASHGNEVLPQDTMYLIQRPCYQRESPCEDPTSSRTTRRPPDHRKETQTAVVRSCLPFIRSGQNHLAGNSERGEKTRQTEVEVGRQHKGMDRPGIRQVPEGSGERKNGENWLRNHLWCLNDLRGYRIDDDEMTTVNYRSVSLRGCPSFALALYLRNAYLYLSNHVLNVVSTPTPPIMSPQCVRVKRIGHTISRPSHCIAMWTSSEASTFLSMAPKKSFLLFFYP